jgi:hypothetical protein
MNTFLIALFACLTLIVLKLFGLIAWNWFWIFSPLVAFVLFILASVIGGAAVIVASFKDDLR